MFSNSDTKKNKNFVGKVQAARQQRAEEKEREKAAIYIQVSLLWSKLVDVEALNKLGFSDTRLREIVYSKTSL